MTATEREFQFVDGGSSKFWKIELDGSSHTVTFGRIGTSGQSKTKSFDTDAAALKDHDKLIAEKTGKGYVEIGGAPATATAAASTAAAKAPAKKSPAKAKAETAEKEPTSV